MNRLYNINILYYVSIYDIDTFPNNFFNINDITKKFVSLNKLDISKISYNLLIKILDNIILNNINYNFNNVFNYYDNKYNINNKEYILLINRYQSQYRNVFMDNIYPIVFG